ncbi:MAG: 4-demethylwyosine synthase TYW1 [Candidatus Aenigmatarchaeota archaeon]
MDDVKQGLKKAGYRFAGPSQNSAVKICEWTRKSLRGQGICYKQKWYGIESHRCLQCTLSLRCNTRCSYCWRSFKAFSDDENNDDPREILGEMIRQQRLLLTGFGGYKDVDKKKWKEAQNPKNFAISLIGESLFYPKLDEFMKIVHKGGGSTFLVTKGTLPDKLKNLGTLPTNLYISMCAPDKATFERVDRPVLKDGWERQQESLEFMDGLKGTNKVIRMTVANGLNMYNPEGYAKLIHKAEPDFIEVKAYMHIGESQSRLPLKAMPYAAVVRDFAKKIADATGYRYKDFFGPSRVALLSRK